ncbi:MAG TPA: FUN14 domain-containing protein [Kiritimatiellia bacterium]|nr:FUN14 domain-containing protein [Kiritimatiellia bacterium]HRZ11995.1 FUN14 domain-containing protein [Kiritimatiellia bacterium]HSA17199.1 FUN14 domain-containing protein [Kiritimatiellia bacterium]
MNLSDHAKPSRNPADRAARKRRRRRRALIVAGLFMAFGVVVAIGERARAPKAGTAGTAVERATPPSAESGDAAEAQAPAARKPALPATFRLGAGYAGGFFLGWLFRKFIKTALLATGALVGLAALARGLGWFDLDWTTAGTYVRESFAWLGGHAGSFKDFIMGYVPSAGAAALGFFFGLWSD